MPQKSELSKRPPVIAVLGHIDHGKSTLLDYIRRSNVAAEEIGGITQQISAYEVERRDQDGAMRRLTFLDTPGHEAFERMRENSAKIADLAVLVISAEEGVKTQTLEAHKTIMEHQLPYVVALNKIDRPGANIDRTRQQLAENEIFLEGYGGKIPAVNISAKTGEGVDILLDIIVLTAELAELRANPKNNARGFVLEAKLNPKTGLEATLIIKDGRLWSGDHLVIERTVSKAKRLYNFLGQPLKTAPAGTPVQVLGFAELPVVGAEFRAFNTKSEAEEFVTQQGRRPEIKTSASTAAASETQLPILIKVGLLGAATAVEHEITKLAREKISPKIISAGAGPITENDVRAASAAPGQSIVIGFQTKTEKAAQLAAERLGVTIVTFDIIYKLSEWLAEELKKREPEAPAEEKPLGRAKILKIFMSEKNRQIVGGVIAEGKAATDKNFKIIRRQNEVGRGVIAELQQQKMAVKEVEAGKQFGALLESKIPAAAGDILEIFDLIKK